MEIYHYDKSGFFSGTSDADESPLEPGVFLIPANATAIAPPEADAGKQIVFQNGAWLVVDIVPPHPPHPPTPPTPEEIKRDFEIAVQMHLDSQAQVRGFGSMLSACSYADDSTVPRFQADGLALRAWRSRVWDYCYRVMNDVETGKVAQPTVADFIASLPTLTLPSL